MPHLQHELEKWDHSHEKHPTLWEMCGLMGCCTLVWKCLENHDILPVMQNLCGFSDRRVGYAQAGRNINLLPCDIPNEWTIISKTATFQESCPQTPDCKTGIMVEVTGTYRVSFNLSLMAPVMGDLTLTVLVNGLPARCRETVMSDSQGPFNYSALLDLRKGDKVTIGAKSTAGASLTITNWCLSINRLASHFKLASLCGDVCSHV